MEWLQDLINGIGDAITDAFESLWETVSNSIWEVFLKWIYEAVYGAIADFFTLMGSVSTVKRAIAELIKAGYIEKVNRRRSNGAKTSNIYICK